MSKRLLSIASSLCLLTSANYLHAAPQHAAPASQNPTATVVPELEPGKTILGQDFNYPTGIPLIKTRIVDLKPGQDIEWHKHAIPVYAYIMSGTLTVDYGSKGQRTIKAGESYIEAIDWCHHGQPADNQPVKLFIVYLGQQEPDQIKPERCLKPE